MKKFFLFVLIVLFASAAKSQTYISGFISPNMTWTVAGSPYIITGNALLMQNDTLTINPGVTVKFDFGTTLQIDGYLSAIGTVSNRITFTSNQQTPQAGDWDELHFSDHAEDAIFDSSGNYLSGCILKYCDVIYGGNNNYGLVHIESSAPYISQCTIQFSNSSGLYCNNASLLPDSSVVKDSKNYGIFFSGCGAKVVNDSIMNNLKGGLYLITTCSVTIKNSYFYNNYLRGAIFSQGTIYNPVFIYDNYFDYNTYNNASNGSFAIINLKSDSLIVDGNYFVNNYNVGNYQGSLFSFLGISAGWDTTEIFRFTNNIIDNNSAIHGTFIVKATNFSTCIIRDNRFINNSVGDYTSAVAGIDCTRDTIECNLFQNNQSGNDAYGALWVYMDGPTFISKNIFDGNFNNAGIQRSVANINCVSGGTDTCFFVNNTIRNNISPSGPCIEFNPKIINQKVLQIHDNNFENNTANGVIKLTGNNTGNINLDFIYFKHNNFSDPNSQCELYNNIPYGSPNVYADSNYWNGTSIQHLDSVIFDYFDNGNLSVVFYQPALTSPVIIDTSCANNPTIVAEITDNSIYSSPHPNPFSNYTTIVFEQELSDATLKIFNSFGQEVKTMCHLNGYNILIERESLTAGIYFYQVVDKTLKTGSGKLVKIE